MSSTKLRRSWAGPHERTEPKRTHARFLRRDRRGLVITLRSRFEHGFAAPTICRCTAVAPSRTVRHPRFWLRIGRHRAGCGYRLTGCDLSAAMIEQAQAADISRDVQWVALEKVPPASPLPFDGSSFDAVISSSVLEYVETIDVTLSEIARILKPGGWIFATVPDMRSPSRQRELWLRRASMIPLLATILDHSRWREGARYQRISINRWPSAKWYAALQAAGFQVEPLPECTGPLVLLSARKMSNNPEECGAHSLSE